VSDGNLRLQQRRASVTADAGATPILQASPSPAAGAPADHAVAADPLEVNGNMWGDEIGDAFGAGGLGLSGVGEGGGRGEGIGLGSIGTLGHGAGTGTGQGFGSGHGR